MLVIEHKVRLLSNEMCCLNFRKSSGRIDRKYHSVIILSVLMPGPGYIKGTGKRKDIFMKSDYVPSEPGVYIVRQAEKETANTKTKKRGIRRRYMLLAVLPVVVLVLCVGLYGIENKAAAFEKQEELSVVQTADAVQGNVDETQDAAKTTNTEGNVVIDKNTQAAVDVQKLAKETKGLSQAVTEDKAMHILDGESLLGYIAQQEITETHEESLSGLLWNYELIADIRTRVEEEKRISGEDIFSEEEYRELLVTMGMDADYVSQDPELPDYLTRTYNPKMDIELNEEELSDLLRLVEAEAPAEDIYGKILVANVVLNRVNNEQMADTVSGVIYEKIGGSAQFSPTAISWYWNSIEVTDSTREAVARCLSGEDYSNGALYFHAWERNPNKHKTSAWMQELECLFTHGGHRFFR